MSKTGSHMVLMARLTCLVLILGIMACASSSEQRSRPPVIKAKTGDDVMLDIVLRLKLAEEQRMTVKPIIQSYADRRNDLIANSLQGGGSLKENFLNLRADIEKMMAVTITEEQMKEFRKYLDEEQKSMGEAKPGKGGGRRGGRGGGFGGGMGGFGR